MKNTLADLNNYFFEELERLNDDSLTDEEFKKECARAKSVQSIGQAIINNASLLLDAAKQVYEQGGKSDMPQMLISGRKE